MTFKIGDKVKTFLPYESMYNNQEGTIISPYKEDLWTVLFTDATLGSIPFFDDELEKI
jgi:hypothetical protein